MTAPFDGVVANLFDKPYNMPKSGEPFCRVIRTSAMEVDFTVLESELPLIKVGDQVEVMPYAAAAGRRTGSISEINPLFVNLLLVVLGFSIISFIVVASAMGIFQMVAYAEIYKILFAFSPFIK